MLVLMECFSDLVVLDLFIIIGRLLQSLPAFSYAYQQVSGRNLAVFFQYS